MKLSALMRSLAWIGLGSVLLLLSACAMTPRFNVDTPHPAPATLVGAAVQLQADPADADSALAATLQQAIVDAMTSAGMRPLLGAPAAYQARYSFRVYVDYDTASIPVPPIYPLWFPPGGWYGAYGWYGYPPPFAPAWYVQPWYHHVLELEIRDTASGALVWRARSSSGSFSPGLDAELARQLAQALLQSFPQASGKRDWRPAH